MTVRVRYAPSPTGLAHVGNVRTAIYNWLYARKMGGTFIARLEDTDRSAERYSPEGIWDLEASMRYLGIVPDEWWVSGGPHEPYVQSRRLPIYLGYAEQLLQSGGAYRCYCTRERLEAMRTEQQLMKQPTGYDRRCRNLSVEERTRLDKAGTPSVVRLAMPLDGETVVHDLIRGEIRYDNRSQDDQVLLKSDGYPTYFLACVVDDHLMGITHVIRGDDWLSSAPKFVQVSRALGWEPPPLAHPSLIVGPDHKKLGKRHGSTQFAEFVRDGYLPEALFNFLVLLGWSPGSEQVELLSVPEIIERFGLEGLSEHPAVFDYDKLRWMNGQYIRASEPGRIIGLCLPYLSQAGLVSDRPTEEELAYVRRVVPLEIERLKTIGEITDLVRFFFKEPAFPAEFDDKGVRKWLKADSAGSILERQMLGFKAVDEWTPERLEEITHASAESLGLPFGPVVHTTRLAATGRTTGPGLFDTLDVLGRDRVLRRLAAVQSQLPLGADTVEAGGDA
ncbi:MAG: glutamate--tRNA ligase [Armatimonadetes bacterium]|nr:glutamate--tRNA ligase [Armatimonadota bacterium]MDE2207272.1 glutamate--tRNA ligase [Armatimonadota bacterium]